MLVTFHSKAYADITMFGDVAIGMLKMMGLSGTVPSALLAADIPAALAQFRAALARAEAAEAKAAAVAEEKDEEEEEKPERVSISHRAIPLIALLEASQAAKCDVMWD